MSKKKLSPWNNNLKFIHSLKPETNFKSNDHPAKPDYSKLSNWAAGGALSTARYSPISAGTQNAAFLAMLNHIMALPGQILLTLL